MKSGQNKKYRLQEEMKNGQNEKWSKWKVAKMESGQNGEWSQ